MKTLAKVGIGCLGVVVTCLGGLVFLAYKVASARLNPTTDFPGRLEQLTRVEQADRTRQRERWDELVALLEAHHALNEEMFAARKEQRVGNDPRHYDPTKLREPVGTHDEKTIAAVTAYLDAVREKGMFAALESIANEGVMVRRLPRGKPLMTMTIFELPQARAMARAVAGEMRLTNRRGDQAGFMQAFAGGCGLGRIYMTQPTLIDRLVGVAIVSLSVAELTQSNIEKPLPAETLEACDAILAGLDATGSSAMSIKAERMMIMDTIQWSHSDDGDGDGWFLPAAGLELGLIPSSQSGPVGALPALNAAGMFYAGRREVEEKIEEHFGKLEAYAKVPRPVRLRHPFQPGSEVEALPPRFAVLKMILPAMSNAIAANEQAAAHVTAARVMISIERFMRENGGDPPRGLEKLQPRYLSEVPVDILSMKPFGYRALEGGADAYGRKYLLYSLGMDQTDNGGIEAPKLEDRIRAILVSTTMLKGVDYVFNDPGELRMKPQAENK